MLGATAADARDAGLTLGPGRGQGEGELYAYIADDHATACMFVTGQGGGCVNAATAPRVQGVMSQVLPGYPGQTPAAVAIVVDNVEHGSAHGPAAEGERPLLLRRPASVSERAASAARPDVSRPWS